MKKIENKEDNLEKKEEEIEKKEDKKVWDKTVNLLAEAELVVNYKPDWTVYVCSNQEYTMAVQ